MHTSKDLECKIFTSYFGNPILKEIPNIILVSIAEVTPKNFKGFEYKKLAPTRQMRSFFADGHSKINYPAIFQTEVLDKRHPEVVLSVLKYISGNSGVICLCCYEKPPLFCHRYLVSNWLSKNCGITIKELPYDKSYPISHFSTIG